VLSAGPYSEPKLKRGIHWLKFKGVKACAPALAALMAPSLQALASPLRLKQVAALVPIPLHWQREKERGFNQAEVLARELAAITQIPVCQALARRRATWVQRQLPADLRQKNMTGAFSQRESWPQEKTVAILVDDVATTGATLAAAAQVLQTDFPTLQVWAVVVARG
jgi:ComF family protein